MSFSFDTNITDIVKGVAMITAVVLAIIFFPKIVDRFSATPTLTVDTTTIEKIAENVVKVHLAENKKELKALFKELKKDNSLAIEQAIKDNVHVKEIASLKSLLKGLTEPDPDVTSTPSGDADGARDLEEFMVHREDAEGNKFPVGIVRVSPNVKEGPKYSYQEFPLEFNANIVSAEKGEEEKRYAEVWVENNFVKSSRGQKYPINLKEVKWAMAPLKPKKFSWNPRLSLGSSFTNTVWYPNLGVSLFSYGRTDRDMDWKFLGLNIGGDSDNIYGGITLFDYNLGNVLPLVDNLFIGPTVTYNLKIEDEIKDEISYGLFFSVPF